MAAEVRWRHLRGNLTSVVVALAAAARCLHVEICLVTPLNIMEVAASDPMADLHRSLGCLLLFLHCVIREVSSTYHHNLSVHFLCDPHEVSPYVRDMPWDCSAYVVCAWGKAIPTQCPAGKSFSGSGRHHKCLPSEIVDHSRCDGAMFSDYLQYLQLHECKSRSCPACQLHHPSCVGMPDGSHPVPERSDVVMECSKDRTVNIVTCPPGYTFDHQAHLCARVKAAEG
ncbi:hypothetical protein C0Q70_21292 [Pomacea canaliculata]|uniref:Chitin-binding type-2 domain-containing protein n=1 Tax=Pomacea canaliculata TaxID=400727 RepID=A0A2T7NC49_POMCA|nr:hypothetical protein C0Q70_21292 [Pomacea canaliculata]